MALNFDNTEVAFDYLNDKELKKSYYIFKLLNHQFLSSLGKSITMSAFSLGLPIKGLVKKTIFNTFVGGETISESEPEISMLNAYNVGVIFDYGAEAKNKEDELDAVADVISNLILQVHDDRRENMEVCAKVSAFAKNELLEKVSTGQELTENENLLWARVIERMDRVSRTAFEHDVQIYFDAEESWMQVAIDELIQMMMSRYNKNKPIIFNTIQLYRHDRLAFLKHLYDDALEDEYILAVKLVRGAYMEKERKRSMEQGYTSPIHLTKEATDTDYNLAVEFCIDHIENICVCVATHNEESNYLLEELLNHRGILHNHPHVISAQLFGMGDHITFNMAAEGYNVAKYLPYGPVKDLLPYLLRRAQENSSVGGQASRELSLVKKELKRRNLRVLF